MARGDGTHESSRPALAAVQASRSTVLPFPDAAAASGRASNFSSGSGANTVRLRRGSASHASSTHSGVGGQPPTINRRRSSSLSDYSQDARDLLNPMPAAEAGEVLRQQRPTSGWDSLPLAFALLPALGGLLVQGGSAFVTDLMLLALGAIFLHWSVTQPWAWYHSAQQIREDQQTSVDCAIGSDMDGGDHNHNHNSELGTAEINTSRPPSPGALEDVPEEGEEAEDVTEGAGQQKKKSARGAAAEDAKSRESSRRLGVQLRQQERRQLREGQEAALRELHRHEVLALMSCFVAPVLGAYLLHGLRGQLTRPSEGLISSYNLTIFILGAEVRPLRHLIQLVRARTLHLQRVVSANPYREEEEQRCRERRAMEEKTQNETLAGIVRRLSALEGRAAGQAEPGLSSRSSARTRQERDEMLHDLRSQLQPELDTLARALRRVHRQLSLLEGRVADQPQAAGLQLGEAVSLARAAALHQQQQQQQQQQWWRKLLRKNRLGLLGIVEVAWNVALWSVRTALAVVLYVPRRAAALLLSAKPPARFMRTNGARGKNKTNTGVAQTLPQLVSRSSSPASPDSGRS